MTRNGSVIPAQAGIQSITKMAVISLVDPVIKAPPRSEVAESVLMSLRVFVAP